MCDLAARAGAGDAGTFADPYMMAFEGALVLRQVYHRNDAARQARPWTEQLIADRIPAARV